MNPPPPTDWQITWDVVLNISLLLFAFTGSFAAIAGKTWDKDDRHVTVLGWIAIICLLLSLGVGVTKEIRTQQKASQQEQARRDAEAESRESQRQSFQLQRLTFEEIHAGKDNISGLVNEVKSVSSDLKALAAKRPDQSAPDVVKANQTAQTATQKAEQTKTESQARTARAIEAILSPDDRAFGQAASDLFQLPATPYLAQSAPFKKLLQLCLKDRRYVRQLVAFAMSPENWDNDGGWLYASYVFRTIAYEDDTHDKRRLEEYAEDVLSFIEEGRTRPAPLGPKVAEILQLLPSSYRRLPTPAEKAGWVFLGLVRSNSPDQFTSATVWTKSSGNQMVKPGDEVTFAQLMNLRETPLTGKVIGTVQPKTVGSVDEVKRMPSSSGSVQIWAKVQLK